MSFTTSHTEQIGAKQKCNHCKMKFQILVIVTSCSDCDEIDSDSGVRIRMGCAECVMKKMEEHMQEHESIDVR